MAELEVSGLCCTFPDGTQALKNINVCFREGSFTIICGENGSGKSVLVRHLNGLLRPTAGKIRLNGTDIHKNIRKTRKTVGMVFQDADSQIVGQTAWLDTAFGPRNLHLTKSEVEKRVENSLREMDLWKRKDDRPHQFSGGEKRRLALAGVLAMDSPLLVFDEPFSNLDYPAVRQVLAHIVALHHKGHTIILITHDLAKVLAHADRVIVLNGGQIAADLVPGEVLGLLEQNGVRRPPEKKISEMTWLK
ncbi:MAG: ABC transporter ATP-binding protein [Spirochaetales bacterium]|nr:ABC transporter ATP-binding protein [Spirochaetales bacterium]